MGLLFRAALGFSLAYCMLYPREAGEWVRTHVPDIHSSRVCVAKAAPSCDAGKQAICLENASAGDCAPRKQAASAGHD